MRRAGLLFMMSLIAGLVAVGSVAGADQDGVEICHVHQDGHEDSPEWQLIEVKNQKSLDKHLEHGDAFPGDPVPGSDGQVFDAECKPLGGTDTIAYYDCFDLETGKVVGDIRDGSGCEAAWDFYFGYNAQTTPHAFVVQNQRQGAQIAYSEEPFADVTIEDVETLEFSGSIIDTAFDQVAVVLTADGKYFKLALESEVFSDVTFHWAPLA